MHSSEKRETAVLMIIGMTIAMMLIIILHRIKNIRIIIIIKINRIVNKSKMRITIKGLDPNYSIKICNRSKSAFTGMLV